MGTGTASALANLPSLSSYTAIHAPLVPTFGGMEEKITIIDAASPPRRLEPRTHQFLEVFHPLDCLELVQPLRIVLCCTKQEQAPIIEHVRVALVHVQHPENGDEVLVSGVKAGTFHGTGASSRCAHVDERSQRQAGDLMVRGVLLDERQHELRSSTCRGCSGVVLVQVQQVG